MGADLVNGMEAKGVLEQAAAQLHDTLVELASRLRPFPPFLNMATVQAIELELPDLLASELGDLGCVVVLEDGEICELELAVIPGPSGPSDSDQVERYRELDLAPEDYILFAAIAIRALRQELRRRDQD